MNLFDTVPQLADSGFLFRIQDNGGRTADRYTVAFCDGDYLSMSAHPSHPQGVSMWGEKADPAQMHEAAENGEEADLCMGDLPDNVAKHVLARVNEGFRDFLAKVEARDPVAVARSRKAAEPNDGTYSSAGVGIYLSGGQFWVAVDDEPKKDHGPFDSPAEALRATLPQDYGFSGPEFHPDVKPWSMVPSPDAAERIAAVTAAAEGNAGPGL